MCLAFLTSAWKRSTLSLEQDWRRGWDVAGALTDRMGGLDPRALLTRTRCAGPPAASSRVGVHYPGEVYEDLFALTTGASRILAGEGVTEFAEWSESRIAAYQVCWRRWADRVLDELDTVEDFPHS
jgi:hypothetical protein